jgi:hypothetical protein
MAFLLLAFCFDPAKYACVFSRGFEDKSTTLGAGTLFEAVVEMAASSDVAVTTLDVAVADVMAGEMFMLVMRRSW